MKSLETQRLILHPFSRKDEALLHRLFIDPFIRKYLWDDEILTRDQSREVLSINLDHFNGDAWGLWKIQEKGKEEVIGFTGLWNFFEEPQPQLLYGLLQAYTGQGFATEAASRIIQYAFEKLDFDYLIASMDEPHQASQQVAKRIGMQVKEIKEMEGKSTIFYQIERNF